MLVPIPPNPDHDSAKEIARIVGPDAVDRCIRQAVGLCWALLPQERRNVGEVKAEMQRITQRVLSDLDEDTAAFGLD